MASLHSIGACFCCWRMASFKSRAASKILSDGVSFGMLMAWCLNDTLSDFRSPQVLGNTPVKVL